MQIFMAGVDARVKAQILDLLGFQEGSFPFRYLGIPLAAEKLKIANYGPLLEAITRRINAWPKHTLSYAGRLELIGTILQGMACYWLSILPIPSGVVDKIKALCRMFVWSSKCPPISWKKICLARQEGGYGLRDLHAWNEALLCKILWNIKSKTDSLWINWVHHHYVKGAEFWAWESKASDSPLIKRLIEIRNKILRGSSGTGSANMKMLDWFAGAQDGVKSAYTFFMPRESEVPWKSMVWKPEIMPKHRFMLWMLAHGRLRTKDRMEYDPNKGCIMCHQEDETNQHLLFECPVACELWSKVKRWLEIKYNFKSFEELNSIFGRHYKGGGSIMKARHLAISSSIYYIWEARNRCWHQDIAPDVEWMFRKVQIHTYRFVDLKPP